MRGALSPADVRCEERSQARQSLSDIAGLPPQNAFQDAARLRTGEARPVPVADLLHTCRDRRDPIVSGASPGNTTLDPPSSKAHVLVARAVASRCNRESDLQ